jgi:hypothetical protein
MTAIERGNLKIRLLDAGQSIAAASDRHTHNGSYSWTIKAIVYGRDTPEADAG